MAPKSRDQPSLDDQSDLTMAINRLADLIDILTRSVDKLVTEIQWQNNERSQDYPAQHLPLASLPRDPTAPNWRPKFGDGQATPIPAEAPTGAQPKPQRLFD